MLEQQENNTEPQSQDIIFHEKLPSWANSEFVEANKYLFFSWLAAISIFVITALIFKTGQQVFPGITHSNQFNVNFQHPVVIDKIFVDSGASVKKGQPLFQLQRPDLEIEITGNQIELQKNLTELNIAYGLERSAVEWSQFLHNKKGANKTLTPLELSFLNFHENAKILQQQKAQLLVTSPHSGHVGEIQLSLGETVSPYTSLVQVYRDRPSTVKSYVPEDFDLINWNERKASKITSMSRPLEVSGKIMAVSTQLIELPQRFQQDPTNRLFGREITIALPPENNLYLGEKVSVTIEGY